ncbi:hypothetical protein [Halorarum salinum]|uniref:DUF6199 domain-containing protein n=1 Tax=Halorarum salinum TaxID=2743089 RepID=A0A7D5Q911_9EURY|nr:hypothetical protein [Halobaculum salinum]QLG60339.1 hypothetical protein HUG12_00630 [Halobaculum salinum]
MQPLIIVMGVFLIVVGAVSIRFPHRMRNYVSSREWQEHPERAERKQELYARAVGVFLMCGLGFMLIFMGLVL